MRKYFISILIISILMMGFPLKFALAQGDFQAAAVPETLEGAKAFGLKILEQIPNAARGVWEEEVLPFFKRFFRGVWDWTWPKIEPFWERKKPVIEKELQKEKEEMREELPKIGKPLWERFKDLLK